MPPAPAGGWRRDVSCHAGRGHRALAQRLAQDGPVHGLVAEDAGRGARQFAFAEQRYGTEVGAHRAALEAGRETQHVGLGLELVGRKRVALPRFGRCAAQFAHRFGEQFGMLLVVPLELHRQIQHRLLQQAAAVAHRVGGDGLQFGAERGIEDAHVRLRSIMLAALFGGQRRTPRHQGHRRGRQGGAGTGQEAAPAQVFEGGKGMDSDDHDELLGWVAKSSAPGSATAARESPRRAWTRDTMRSQRWPSNAKTLSSSGPRRCPRDSRRRALARTRRTLVLASEIPSEAAVSSTLKPSTARRMKTQRYASGSSSTECSIRRRRSLRIARVSGVSGTPAAPASMTASPSACASVPPRNRCLRSRAWLTMIRVSQVDRRASPRKPAIARWALM